ncbi:MAG: hypothetical protein HGA22_02460 [Clostridiales bacterium]|nr:hypothetical protein [Clostridiales bacterium]
MAVSYNIVFSPEEATHWVCFDEVEDREFIPQKPYTVFKETVDDKLVYYVLNEMGVKIYDAWKRIRGDYVSTW